jgi:DNA polymerase-1
MKVWLLVDLSYLAWRSHYTTGGLQHDGINTGISFGVLRDLEYLADLHSANRVIVACDGGGGGKRVEICPTYKKSRGEEFCTPVEIEERRQFYEELARLQRDILPQAGYKNILRVPGYEGDDIIAKIAQDIPLDVEAVIISADGDLLQCLDDRVILYNPTKKKAITSKAFREKWGIAPHQWSSVKAWAGCGTDDIEGVKGVGEITAVKWLKGLIKEGTDTYDKFNNNFDVFNRNMPLVRLPFPGLELPPLRDDEVDAAKMSKVRTDLGIRTKRPTRQESGFNL